jgi:hypothetical protein
MYMVNQYVCVDILPSVFYSNRKKRAENTDEVVSTFFAKVCLSVRFVMKLVLALKIFMISSTEFRENPQDGFVADYKSRRTNVVLCKYLMVFPTELVGCTVWSESVYVFCVDLRTNSDYFTVHH